MPLGCKHNKVEWTNVDPAGATQPVHWFLGGNGLGIQLYETSEWVGSPKFLDPCLVFSENDSKLYINFEFCEKKNHRHLGKTC